MTPGNAWRSFVADEAAMLTLAANMARQLPAAPPPFVLYLHGDLGTGKTTLSRGILHALGERGAVRSPTYGLIAEYATPTGAVLHLDLYRLRSPAELQQLGVADYLPGSRLWLVEWPALAGGAGLPAADAQVSLTVESGGRRVDIEARTPAGHAWVRTLPAETGS